MSETIPIDDGPRERLLLRGPSGLSDADLVAVLLGTGAAREPVGVLAARLLAECGGLAALRRRSPSAMAALRGVGRAKAARICAAIELGSRALQEPLTLGTPIRSSRDVDAALRPRLRSEPREHFLALALDVRHRPLAEILVAVGSLDSCGFTPADAFRRVVQEAASAVVFVHNHPSGEPAPSPEDREMTRRLQQVADLLGIRLLDHIILGADGYFSFLDAGLLAPGLGAA